MTFDDFIEEVRHHELMLKVMLEYQNADNICEVSQSEVAHRINKNKTWVSKAIERLNAEDLCVEQIKNGKYKIHYVNIMDRGVFYKIFKLVLDKLTLRDFTDRKILLAEKYGLSRKTIQIFTGYLGFLQS